MAAIPFDQLFVVTISAKYSGTDPADDVVYTDKAEAEKERDARQASLAGQRHSLKYAVTDLASFLSDMKREAHQEGYRDGAESERHD